MVSTSRTTALHINAYPDPRNHIYERMYLTEWILGDDGSGFLKPISLPDIVDCADAELVAGVLLEALHLTGGLLAGGEDGGPILVPLFAFHDVVSDLRASVVLRRAPRETGAEGGRVRDLQWALADARTTYRDNNST